MVVREETEWMELVENGFSEIVGSIQSNIVTSFNRFKDSNSDFSLQLYGNNVGEHIYKSIVSLINT